MSPLGLNTDSFWKSLLEARSGIGEIQSIDPAQIRFKYGAEIKNYVSEDHFDAKDASFMERFTQFAVVAAEEAVVGAGIEWTGALRESRPWLPGHAWVAGQLKRPATGNSSTTAGAGFIRLPFRSA